MKEEIFDIDFKVIKDNELQTIGQRINTNPIEVLTSTNEDEAMIDSPVENQRAYRDADCFQFQSRSQLSPPNLTIPEMALNDELILNDAELSLLQHQLDLSEYYHDDYSSSLSSYIQPPQMLPNTHSVLTSSKSNSSLSTYLDYGCSASFEHSRNLQVSNNSASKARRSIFRNLNNDASISAANSFVDSHLTTATAATTAVATVRNPLLANPFLFSRVSNITSTSSNMKVAYGGFVAAATATASAAAALAQTQANLMSLNRFKLADDDDELIQGSILKIFIAVFKILIIKKAKIIKCNNVIM